jgi:aspartyl-tRNA(Asn)/glutamyl-tRNA(Gln) amidotransferase subunit A
VSLGAVIAALDAPAGGPTLGVKDNMDVAGTVRSDGLGPPWPPPAETDAACVARMRAAGYAVVAKTNLEELSFAATTQNAYWGACRNPWDVTRLPGGSSGGSAAAVAAGLVDVALGTDTGGSIRNPASFCGVTGLRTTVGSIPFDGVTDLAPEFDAIGPLARSAAEVGRALEALTGERRQHPPPRIGVPDEFFFDDLHPDVAAGMEALIAELKPAAIRLRGAADAGPALQILLNSKAAELHPHWLDDERVEPRIRERLVLGAQVTTAEREEARAVAERWRAAVARAFDDVDVLVCPTTPFPAPLLDDVSAVAVSRAINRLNAPWSLAQLPAISVPLPQNGLPVGGQLVAPPGGDWLLVALAERLQLATGWHLARP